MADRIFTVGDTVDLVVRVSASGTRNPADPAQGVTLLGVSQGTTQKIDEQAEFTKVDAGQYVYVVETEGWDPGVYNWLAVAKADAQRVVQIEDNFVLKERTTLVAPEPTV